MTVITKTSERYLLDVDTVNGPKPLTMTGVKLLRLATEINRFIKIEHV
jgi:hypothetical protein